MLSNHAKRVRQVVRFGRIVHGHGNRTLDNVHGRARGELRARLRELGQAGVILVLTLFVAVERFGPL